jgi:polar amino acid transport system substrate-binding protein
MVGFNRRFSKPFAEIKKFFGNSQEPFVINYRVHAGFIPKEHWIQAPEQGGRIIGEACHFIDTMQFITGAEPVSVFAESISSENRQVNNYDNVAVIINFSDGSVGNLLYLANGDSSVSKEKCEVFSGGKTATMHNFESVEIHLNNKMSFKKFDGRKGHREEVKYFCDVITGKAKPTLTFRSIWLTTMATFRILESLRTGKRQRV